MEDSIRRVDGLRVEACKACDQPDQMTLEENEPGYWQIVCNCGTSGPLVRKRSFAAFMWNWVMNPALREQEAAR